MATEGQMTIWNLLLQACGILFLVQLVVVGITFLIFWSLDKNRDLI